MWNGAYRREASNDDFQNLPCLTASSGLLTPPSSYNFDARRNSTASSLSSFGPTTPVYGRNPFSDHSHVSFTSIDECHDESIAALAMAYPFKVPHPENTPYADWSASAHPSSLEHSLSAHGSFASQPSVLQAHMMSFTVGEDSGTSLPMSGATVFDGLPYVDVNEGTTHESDITVSGDHIPPVWPYQYAMDQAPTMAPALLGGPYVEMGSADPDSDMSGYHDADMPLSPTPQEVVLRHEGYEMSENKKRVKRSIHVSSTGGKTIKREQKSQQAKLPRARRSKPEHVHTAQVHDITLIRKSLHVCSMMQDGKPCGSKFKRQEHLHRHERTHSGQKPYQCQVPRCMRRFDRNDNLWAHIWTHVHRPGKKHSRNPRYSLRRVLRLYSDPKLVDKLTRNWFNELKYPYDPEAEDVSSDDDTPSPAVIKVEEFSTSLAEVESE